ncbi:MAG: glutamate synthase subunit beta [Cytophagaceae bacterium]|nr:glutamate synthase subunit beta [Gemmatimonadaceae bacterium]
MGDASGVSSGRQERRLRPVGERTTDWRELYLPDDTTVTRGQAGRCMDCGVPFCQGDTGCPVQNVIPEWNALVNAGRWQEASAALHATNNFPELTGRLCPAPCESACVLGLVDQPVTIRNIEQAIADRAFREGWITPVPSVTRIGHRVAIVGSGPAGLAAAQQLVRQGHDVVVFEKDDRIGGLLRYGIPDFKLGKSVLEARLRQLESEGVTFEPGVNVGVDFDASVLRADFDAVLIATGARQARDLVVEGRDLAGVERAMDFLSLQNRVEAGDGVDVPKRLSARGKHVIVIGGGDTGSDCVGTCHRQGARSVLQVEVLAQPPVSRDASTPWPLWPLQLRTSHAHLEGGQRQWEVRTTRIVGSGGKVRAVQAMRGAGETVTLPADLVLLAMGFTGVEPSPLYEVLGATLGPRATVPTDRTHATVTEGVFAAGDARRGASLIVWAIREGRDAAAAIGRYLARAGARRPAPMSRFAASGRIVGHADSLS